MYSEPHPQMLKVTAIGYLAKERFLDRSPLIPDRNRSFHFSHTLLRCKACGMAHHLFYNKMIEAKGIPCRKCGSDTEQVRYRFVERLGDHVYIGVDNSVYSLKDGYFRDFG